MQIKTNSAVLFILLFSFLIFSHIAFSQDGQLDITWGGTGKIKTVISSKEDWANSAALQKDGKIVVVGASDNNFVVVRFNTDGSLDNLFGGSGKVTTSIGTGTAYGRSVALQADGKLVVAGRSSSNPLGPDFTVVRYNADGTLDNNFDGDGIVTTDIGGKADNSMSIALQADGKIIVAGDSFIGVDANNYNIRAFVIARYNVDGSLDSTFGDNGKVATRITTSSDYGSYDYANKVVIQSDGKILVTGYSYLGKIAPDFSIVRYNPDGSLDNSFDSDGKVTTEIGSGEDIAYAVALQEDDKIILVGYTWNDSESQSDIAVVRYEVDGSLDNTFGSNGIVTTNIAKNDIANSVFIQADGKIIVAGYSGDFINEDFLVMRYNIDGSLDNTFNNDGKVITDIQNSYDHSSSLVLQPNGRIVIAGNTRTNYSSFDNHIAVVRYMGSSGPVSVDVEFGIHAKEFILSQNYPNPFNPSTTIEFVLPKAEYVTLKVYNIRGEEVATVMEGNLSSGRHLSEWNANGFTSGVYFYTLQTASFFESKKLIILK